MKSMILAALFLGALSLNAQVINVKTPLKSQEIYKVVKASAKDFLNFEGDFVGGGLYGELSKPTIVQLTKKDGIVTDLVVEYFAFFMSVDFEFGDPVDEEETFCTSSLTKGNDGKYSKDLTKTTCDFNPSVDADDSYREDPCCENGTPVVDSNWCFDYYEEGAEYCAQYAN